MSKVYSGTFTKILPYAILHTGEDDVSYQFKESIVSLLTGLCANIGYFLFLGPTLVSQFDSAAFELSWWSSMVLFQFLVLVAAQVIIQFTFLVVYKAVRKDSPPKTKDELDKIVLLRSHRLAYLGLGLGILASVLAANLGNSVKYLFLGISISVVISGLALDLRRIQLYQRGF